jgi:hypothetical protein
LLLTAFGLFSRKINRLLLKLKLFEIRKMFRPFLAVFGKIAISQPKRIQNKKISHVRITRQKLSYKIRSKNRISKNVMEILGDGNSNLPYNIMSHNNLFWLQFQIPNINILYTNRFVSTREYYDEKIKFL